MNVETPVYVNTSYSLIMLKQKIKILVINLPWYCIIFSAKLSVTSIFYYCKSDIKRALYWSVKLV